MAVAFWLGWAGTSHANLAVLKAYKETFDEKPKCTACHVDKTPKKEDGKHDPSEYGKKLIAAKKEMGKDKVDADVLKKVGKSPESAE